MVKVGIVGVTGYSGEELLKIIASHPGVALTYAAARQERQESLASLFPYLSLKDDVKCSSFNLDEASEKTDLVFLALPHFVSMDVAPQLLARGKKVVDISADYRIKDSALYKEFYGKDHQDLEGLSQAVYSIPELDRDKVSGASFVSNPGCYPTSIILGLAPLFKINLPIKNFIIDSKSGVTGAGRKVSSTLQFSEVNENFKAYKVEKHQHESEIQQFLNSKNSKVKFDFVPHLLPVNRGILSTMYCSLDSSISKEDVRQAFVDFYKNEAFVKVLPEGVYPEISKVTNTNQCHIGLAYRENTNTLIIISCIDNLLKGASGQAVQNMNLMLGIAESEGLV